MSTERCFIVTTNVNSYVCMGNDFFAALSAYRAAYPTCSCWSEIVIEVIEI